MILTCLVVVLMCSVVWSFEAPEEKKDVFSSTACPAFLTFTNAAFIAGVTVELPCHCKPEEVQSVVWFFRKHWSSFDETRALTDNHGNKLLDTSQVPHSSDLRSRFSIRMFSLLIFRAGPEDSGLYICGSAHKDFFYGYDLDIQEAPALKNFVMTFSFIVYSHPMYKVFISFRSWSVCDRCGAPGEQVRIGLCYVYSRFLHVRYRLANQTVASCGSEGVPVSFSRINQEPKVEIRSCQVTCPPEPSPPSKLTLPAVVYQSLFHGVVTLGCPGARPNMVVGWDQGSNPIYRSEKTSPGNFYPRIKIDTGHHLHSLLSCFHPSGVYYCWLQGRRAAQIRLLVYVHLGKDQTAWAHPDFTESMRTLFTYYVVMTVVFCLMLIGRIGYELIRNRFETHND
uniref:Family with sequence similarity 187 member A n=1 Tax=Poecilia latipinna TaxID=48699 RepID=A0A3B3TZA1_9TELE